MEAIDESIAQGNTTLMTIKEDALLIILANLDFTATASVAACCLHFSRLCRHTQLWQTLVLKEWPLLPLRLRTPSTSLTWTSVARKRLGERQRGEADERRTPMRRAWGVMDEVEHLIQLHSDFAEEDCDRLASLIVSVFVGCSVDDAWLGAISSPCAQPAFIQVLSCWAKTRADALDAFYEGCESGSCTAILARRSLLLQAMRAASALRFLQDHVLDTAGLMMWSAAGLSGASEAIASALASLELEGFNVAIPPSLLPGRVPQSHRWWLARQPMHAAGRIHYC